MSKYIVQDTSLTAVANAIRAKSGGAGQLLFPAGFVSEIGNIPESSIPEDPNYLKEVVFVDYDGTVVYQYTEQEFLALSAMPANPSHVGLVAQGWNWDLADAKTYVQNYHCLCIGQNYTTSDGKTRVYIIVTEKSKDFDYGIGIYTTEKGGVTINWGDGASTVTDANAGTFKSYKHKYSTAGKYTITLSRTSGGYSIGYNGANNTFLNGGSNVAKILVEKIEIGDYISVMHRQALQDTTLLKTVSIPNTLIDFGDGTTGNIFYNCINLKCVVFPKGSTLHGANIFGYCYSIKFISMPKDISITPAQSLFAGSLKSLRMITFPEMSGTANTLCSDVYSLCRFSYPGTYATIPQYFLSNAFELKSELIIPSTVISISDYALTGTRVEVLRMLPTTPPTIANVRGMPPMSEGITRIIVPHGCLTAYQTANKWSTYAQYMEEAPA